MELSASTKRAVKAYGAAVCVACYEQNLDGEGASTIGITNGHIKLTTRQADAAINAGRELANLPLPGLTQDEQFFYDNAGSSYDPIKQTKEQGKIEGAKKLAAAEAAARQKGYSFNWEIDRLTDSSDFSTSRPAWKLWVCSIYDGEGEYVNCIGGVDFGRGGAPWGEDYRRVVDGELALEEMK